MIKLVVFDMDGVLVDTKSSWYYVHSYYGTDNLQNILAYREKQIDYLQFMHMDIALWLQHENPINIKKISKILNTVPIMPGATEVFKQLKAKHIKTAIITSGLDILAKRLKHMFNIDYIYANGIETDIRGNLTGNGVIRVEPRNKGQVLEMLINRLHLNATNVAVVGDGEIDIAMFEKVQLSIAFDPITTNVSRQAKIVINDKDLTKILPYII